MLKNSFSQGSLRLGWLVHRLLGSSSAPRSTSRSISSGKQLGVLATQHNDAFLTNVPLLFLGLNQETKAFRATSLLTWEQVVSDTAFRRWFRPLPASYEDCNEPIHRQFVRCHAAGRLAQRYVKKLRRRHSRVQTCSTPHGSQDVSLDHSSDRTGTYEKHKEASHNTCGVTSPKETSYFGQHQMNRQPCYRRKKASVCLRRRSSCAAAKQQPTGYKQGDEAIKPSMTAPAACVLGHQQTDSIEVQEQTSDASVKELGLQDVFTQQTLSFEADTDVDDIDDDYWSVELEDDNGLHTLRNLMMQQGHEYSWYQFRTPANRGSLVFGYWGVCPYG